MSIYTLYIKTHRKTGLKYLGITKKKNVLKYPGSGIRWSNHLAEHGDDCDTTILLKTPSLSELATAGNYYSQLWNIVKDKCWANLKPETGYGGSIITGKVTVYDKNGDTVYVNKDDPRIAMGELTYVGTVFNTGMVVVQDNHNNITRVSVSDPRYLSGELTHINKGRIHNKIACKFCNSKFDEIQINTHQDSCKLNPDRVPGRNTGKKFPSKLKSCCYCSRQISLGNISKHENKCGLNPNI